MNIVAPLKGLLKNQWVLFGLIAILVIGITVGGVNLMPLTFNTEGEVQGAHAHYGKIELSDYNYATAWKSSGQSQLITVVPAIKKVGVSFHDPEWYYLIATVNGVTVNRKPATGHIDFPDYGWNWDDDQWRLLDLWSFYIPGIVPDHSQLKVQMIVKLDASWPYNDWEGDFGWDGARLKSGAGLIYNYGTQTSFEEGEKVPIYIKTGYTGIPDGWSVKLRTPDDRPDLNDEIVATYGDNDETILYITVKPGWFKVGSTNHYEAELWNHLFQTGETYFFTLDMHERKPTTPIITFFTSGNSMVVTATSEKTYDDIQNFWVWAYYGGLTMPSDDDTQSWIIKEQIYSASSGTGSNYSVSFDVDGKNFDGDIMVKVVAHDGSRASDTGFLSMHYLYNNGGFEPNPPPNFTPFMWSFWMILIILLAGILSYFVVVQFPGKMEQKIALIAIILILTGFGFWYLGTNPGVLGGII